MAHSPTLAPQRTGEVISANSTSFVAQCYELYDAPPLGSLVQAGTPPIFGVVCEVRTEPLDPSRPVLARGENAAAEEEVYRDNPQINRLLTTRFEALIVGYRADEVYHHRLPPLPPRVHSFVHTCPRDEAGVFAEDLGFLRILARDGRLASDEVIGAAVQRVSAAFGDSEDFMVRAGRLLAGELSGDLPRLNAILRRISS
jgi:hypothetical protein